MSDSLEASADPELSAKAPSQSIDEVALIEERRKRREAIKAKHQSQAPPITEAGTATGNGQNHKTAPTQAPSQGDSYHACRTTLVDRGSIDASNSPMPITGETSREASPPLLDLSKHLDSGDSTAQSSRGVEDDGPSAADYDPTKDMEEDQFRHDQQLLDKDMSAATFDEKAFTDQNVLLPERSHGLTPLQSTANKVSDGDFDMFGDDDDGVDMFAEQQEDKNDQLMTSTKAVEVPKSKALNVSTLDDWDDSEGYYKVILGELLDSRYHVQSNLGKGMFSGVVRATDTTTQRMVAIKIIRNNETMRRAGFKEMDILQRLAAHDPEDKKHVVRLEGSFEYKGHLCMVFENLR